MSGKLKKLLSRGLSFTLLMTLLFAYGCGKKTVVFDDYPTAEPSNETNVGEQNTNEEATNQVFGSDISNEDLLKPEINTLKETGEYVYNPVVIPNWILDEYRDNPDIIRVTKEVLVALDNHKTELVIDEKIELTQSDINYISNAVYFSNPVSSIITVNPTDKKNVFSLSYYLDESEAEDEELEKYLEDFRDYVTETINNNLNSDMSEKEMAEILYKKLVTEIDFEPVDGEYIGGTASNFASGEILKVPSDHKLSSGDELLRLYMFFLTQLHIDTERVGTTNGYFTQDVKDVLGDKAPISYYWAWMILSLDGEYYNNDIILEKLMFDVKYQGAEGTEPDMDYFAMSDETRVKSYKVGKASVFSLNTLDESSFGNNYDVPVCQKDYE